MKEKTWAKDRNRDWSQLEGPLESPGAKLERYGLAPKIMKRGSASCEKKNWRGQSRGCSCGLMKDWNRGYIVNQKWKLKPISSCFELWSGAIIQIFYHGKTRKPLSYLLQIQFCLVWPWLDTRKNLFNFPLQEQHLQDILKNNFLCFESSKRFLLVFHPFSVWKRKKFHFTRISFLKSNRFQMF